jgi:hypothetical protein
MEKTFQIECKQSAAPTSHAIGIEYKYEYVEEDVRKSFTTSEQIAIPVFQIDRLNVTSGDLIESVTVGDRQSFEISFINKGKTEASNITATITGNISEDGESEYIGNILAGASDEVEFYLTPLKAGEVTGELLVTYEDPSYKTKTVSIPFSFMAEEAAIPSMPNCFRATWTLMGQTCSLRADFSPRRPAGPPAWVRPLY